MAVFIITVTLIKPRNLVFVFFFFFSRTGDINTPFITVGGWGFGVGVASVYFYFSPHCDSCTQPASYVQQGNTHSYSTLTHCLHMYVSYALKHTQTPMWWRWWRCVLPLFVVRPSRSAWFSKPRQRPATETGNSWREDTHTQDSSINQSIKNQQSSKILQELGCGGKEKQKPNRTWTLLLDSPSLFFWFFFFTYSSI